MARFWFACTVACPILAALFAIARTWLFRGKWLYFDLPSRDAFIEFFPFAYYPEQDCVPGLEGDRLEYTEWSCPWHRRGLLARFNFSSLRPAAPQGPQAWSAGSDGSDRPRAARAVFAPPRELPRLLAAAVGPRAQAPVLVLGGGVTALSEALGANASRRAGAIARLGRAFEAVFYYVKDVEAEGVLTMPIALPLWFFRDAGLLRAATRAIAAARLDGSTKARGLLVAGGELQAGSPGTHLRLAHDSPDEQSWRLHWRRWTPPSWQIAKEAFRERRQLLEWASTDAAAHAGAELRSLDQDAWWRHLPSYRFLACPIGSEIQSHKVIEALLVLTVPVVRRGRFPVWDDLLLLGFPLAVVEEWSEISPGKLAEWWTILEPRLSSFRRHCLTTEGYWRIFVGQKHSCF